MAHHELTGVTRSKVLKILMREADLDGIVIVTEREIAAELGLHTSTIGEHIYKLISDGKITNMSRGAGWNGIGNVIQLADGLY